MKRLPVVNFAAGGIATPSDAALMMHLGCDGILLEAEFSRAKSGCNGKSYRAGNNPFQQV